MEEENNKIVENVKFERTASGKYVYSFRCLGEPEKLIERVKELKKEYDKLIE